MRKTLLRALAAVWILALALLLWRGAVLADRAGALASLDAQTDLQCAEALSAIHTSLFYTDSSDQAQLALAGGRLSALLPFSALSQVEGAEALCHRYLYLAQQPAAARDIGPELQEMLRELISALHDPQQWDTFRAQCPAALEQLTAAIL